MHGDGVGGTAFGVVGTVDVVDGCVMVGTTILWVVSSDDDGNFGSGWVNVHGSGGIKVGEDDFRAIVGFSGRDKVVNDGDKTVVMPPREFVCSV